MMMLLAAISKLRLNWVKSPFLFPAFFLQSIIYLHLPPLHTHIYLYIDLEKEIDLQLMEAMEEIKKKSKVLVVGGTGYMGRRIVKASLAEGHPTFVLHRPEIGIDVEKVQMLMSFKGSGARLLPGSFSDHRSLVDAVSQVDVVISAVSGAHHRSHEILVQLKLVAAIKEAGNVKRFLPSEFGTDPGRMGHALAPGRVTFDEKMEVRRAIEEANIPFTYVSANCFMGYFVGGLCQRGTLIPPTDHVYLHGDGNVKSIFVDEDDIALYTIKMIDDPRTLNKTVYIRPPDNILSQREIVKAWEDLIGKELLKTSISEAELFASFEGLGFAGQVAVGHFFHFFYEGCLANFDVEDDDEATHLYPEIAYCRVKDYLKRFL